ncbi:MAG: transketolase family protein [Methanomicrobia archaeon]|nr:transketolase family protein [Methanomicrobia archaeon]HDM22555.1 transketolase family protein [Methanomicrobia archaeon]
MFKEYKYPREAYGKTLRQLGRERKDIVVVDADLSSSTKTKFFADEFPDRFFNMGVAEQNMVGVAAGLATTGKTVFASSFAMFIVGRGYDQIRQSIAYPKLNVKIVATHAGITVGGDGASHQIIEDIALMCALPNMSVFVPADNVETEKIIRSIADYRGPAYVRLGRSKVPTIYDQSYEFQQGKASVLREGDDITIIALGIMVSEALIASEELEKKGISARVINMSTVKPIDREAIIKAAKETGAIITAEEHNTIMGMGSLVASIVAENYPVYVYKCGIPDVFGESGDYRELMEKYGLTSKNIIKAAENIIRKR